jgi:hypothetical protein
MKSEKFSFIEIKAFYRTEVVFFEKLLNLKLFITAFLTFFYYFLNFISFSFNCLSSNLIKRYFLHLLYTQFSHQHQLTTESMAIVVTMTR